MKKLFSFLFLTMFIMFGLQSCDDGDNIVGGGIDPEPELVGCEAADMYDWETVEFSTSLDGGADTWIAFNLEELTYFTVFINQPGFLISIYEYCEGEFGSGDTLFQWQTNGDDYDIGIAVPEDYYVNILNTRPSRMDFTFSLTTSEIVYGCMNDDAINYDETANIDDGSCELNDCSVDYWVEEYQDYASNIWGELVLDCDGNCGPLNWVGDGWCDTGDWGIYDSEGNIVGINLWCEELDWDNGDCDVIVEECPEGLIEDCNGVCAPTSWLGDGFCDDGSYEYNGNAIFFNCEEYNNDEGDCDVLQRSTEARPYPNGRIKVN